MFIRLGTELGILTNEGGSPAPSVINREPCGQSYKTFTLINYDSRVVKWGIFKSGTTLES